MISEFGENTNSYCSFESKETALLHSENGNLQQRVNALTHEVRGQMRTREEDREDTSMNTLDGIKLNPYLTKGSFFFFLLLEFGTNPSMLVN